MDNKIILFINFILFSILFFFLWQLDDNVLNAYGIFLMIYLFSKMLFSFTYKEYKGTVKKDYKVACVIPSYNEAGNGLINTLESIANQTYPVEEIYFIDDGSPDKSGMLELMAYVNNNKEKYKNVIIHLAEQNKGKRHAQAYAFERSNADVFFTVDSDTYVYPNALEELLKAFNDEKVFAVTGHVNARNRDENLLTRLIDIRYDNAFRVERAAQSYTGNILTCSGPLSCYRREVVIPNLEHYTNQKFLGVPVNIGDDRCLTNFANRLGKTKYQTTARATTDVPNNINQFLRQQIRWNKSFFRESIIAVKMINKRPIVAFWSLLEIVLFFMLTFSMFVFIFSFERGLHSVFVLIAGVILSAFARNIHYAIKHPFLFLISPLYAMLHLFLLQPIRMYALLTIRDAKWGTREKLTEVHIEEKEEDNE
ncbi:glycosyltransferase [Streptococcus hillyeri]|uniref:Hyaluronan synthase n=1 Tax=Streptococcus hillyeri TaxID=2282420 RepID=A0A3L9DUM4_9STRE|nr:glycosyltransferase [Streptococcus hillyeri]RLY02440.1 glycosyltransferase [Streptococcus hillyeri]